MMVIAIGAATAADPVIVENGDSPSEGLQTVDLTELWRAGGEDDEIFFGNISAVRTDPDGMIYLLDSQLSEVHVYSPDGEHLRTVGREGDGPGEVRGSADMFISDDGKINILQSMPGRIVKLTPEGLPAGEAFFSTGPDNPRQFGVLVLGRSAGADIVLAGIRMVLSGGVNMQTYFLSRCDSQAIQKSVLSEKIHEVNMADFKLDELEMDFVWSRMAVGGDGKVYAGVARNEYRIEVYGDDGSLERTITRAYAAPKRNEQQREIARQIVAAVGANYPIPPNEITIEDTEPVLANINVTADGRIWTQTSLGNSDGPDGAWVVMDVFDPDGKFAKQVALRGIHDPRRDAVYILPDERVVVVSGALDAWLNQQGVSGDDGAAVESDPLEVFCYRMGP